MQRHSPKEIDRRQRQSGQDRILRDKEVRDRTGLSRTTRWRLIRAEKFPKPIKLTEHAIGWRESSIEEWLASREQASLRRLLAARSSSGCLPPAGRQTVLQFTYELTQQLSQTCIRQAGHLRRLGRGRRQSE